MWGCRGAVHGPHMPAGSRARKANVCSSRPPVPAGSACVRRHIQIAAGRPPARACMHSTDPASAHLEMRARVGGPGRRPVPPSTVGRERPPIAIAWRVGPTLPIRGVRSRPCEAACSHRAGARAAGPCRARMIRCGTRATSDFGQSPNPLDAPRGCPEGIQHACMGGILAGKGAGSSQVSHFPGR